MSRSVQDFYIEFLLRLFDALHDEKQDWSEIQVLKQNVVQEMVEFSSPQLQILRFRQLMDFTHLDKNVFRVGDFYNHLPQNASPELQLYIENYMSE